MTNRSALSQDDENEIKDLLIGRRIVAARADTLFLDNGVEIEVFPNQGCGGCSSGWYEVEEIHKCEAVITNVRFDTEDRDGECACAYKIFVLAAGNETLALSVAGDDGNGYYGTGYTLQIKNVLKG